MSPRLPRFFASFFDPLFLFFCPKTRAAKRRLQIPPRPICPSDCFQPHPRTRLFCAPPFLHRKNTRRGRFFPAPHPRRFFARPVFASAPVISTARPPLCPRAAFCASPFRTDKSLNGMRKHHAPAFFTSLFYISFFTSPLSLRQKPQWDEEAPRIICTILLRALLFAQITVSVG